MKNRLISIFTFLSVATIGGGILAWKQQSIPPVAENRDPQGQNETQLGKILHTVQESPSPSPVPSLPPLPQQKVLSGSKHVYQTFNNCGPASLSMALSFYGYDVSQETLGNELRPYQHPEGDNDDKSVTLEELAHKAREYDLLAYHRPAGTVEILQQFIAHEIPVITRTWLKPGEDIGHYRVVKGFDQTRGVLIQDDSLQGHDLTYTYDEFNQLWRAFNYEFLVIVPPEQQALAEQILAQKLDEKQAWEIALNQAEQHVANDPTDTYAAFNKAVAQYHLGDYQGALQTYESVANQLPGRMLWYQIEPLLAYYQTGRYQQALQRSQSIIDNNNRAFSELHWLQGMIYEKQNKPTAAEAAYARAQQYNSSDYWRANLPE